MIPGETLGTKISNVLIPPSFIILGLASIVGGFSGAGFWLVPLGGLFLLIGIGLIRIGINMIKEEKIKRIEKEKREKEEKKKKQEELQAWEQGKWTISASDFYKALQQSKIKSLNTEFAFQKAVVVATDMMNKANVPQKYHSVYLSEEKLKELFESGRKESARLSKEAQEAALIEEERKRTTPVEGKPTKDVEEKIEFTRRICTLTGLEKRKKMLELALASCKEEMRTISQRVYDLKNPDHSGVVAMTAHLINASQEKPQSWGLAGGIASGIAGPAAGVMAASEVMAENARIERKNAAVREQYTNMAARILSTDHTREIEEYEKQYEQLSCKVKSLEAALTELPLKVVFKDDKSVLKRHVNISDVSVQPTPSGVLSVSMWLKSNYVADVPDGVSVILDGSVRVDIFCDEVHVGVAHALLPIYGLEKGNPTLLHAFCTKYLEGTRNYRAEVSFLNLWAMEQ